MKRSLSVLFLIVLSLSAFSQEAKKWSLEDCISYALLNNIQIKREILQSQKFDKDRTQAYVNFAPSLNGNIQHFSVDGLDYNQYESKFENFSYQGGNLGIGGRLDLFQSFNKWNNLAKTKFDLLASLEGVEELKRNIALNITAKYLEALYANENLFLSEKRVEVANSQLESSSKKYELGRISNSEFLQIKAQAINERSQLTNARNAKVMTYLELAQLLELDSTGGFQIVTENINVVTDTLHQSMNQYFSEAINSSPSLKIADYRYQSAKRSYYMALSSLFPNVSFNYQVGTSYSELAVIRDQFNNIIKKYPSYSFVDQSKDNIQKYFALQVNVPIFNQLLNKTRITKTKIDRLDAQYAIEQAKKNLLKNIQQSYTDANAEYYRYQSLAEAELSFREAYEMSKEKFDLGMINAVDYGVARNNYIKAQGDFLHAKYSYLFKLKILDFYRGVPISL